MWTLYSVKPCCDSLKEAFFFFYISMEWTESNEDNKQETTEKVKKGPNKSNQKKVTDAD